ncbi:MAG: hypothetical protein M0Q88_00080 [Bacilli bacterium]|nr:hypothetical protein [Bacilli bacterium]
MRQIRHNVFETNSSSTHSLVMAIANDFNKWEDGTTYYCQSSYGQIREAGFKTGNFYPKDVVDAYYEKIDYERDTYSFCTYDEFIDTDSLEVDTYEYETPGGDVIKAVAKYGYDG